MKDLIHLSFFCGKFLYTQLKRKLCAVRQDTRAHGQKTTANVPSLGVGVDLAHTKLAEQMMCVSCAIRANAAHLGGTFSC